MKLKDLKNILEHPLPRYTIWITLFDINTGDAIMDLCTIGYAMNNFGECIVNIIYPEDDCLVIGIAVD